MADFSAQLDGSHASESDGIATGEMPRPHADPVISFDRVRNCVPADVEKADGPDNTPGHIRPAHRFIRIPKADARDIRIAFLDLAEPDVYGCWIWRGDPANYGRFEINGTLYPAHRVSVRLFHRTFDQNLHVLHTCDTPGCVNPGHLWTGTDADNMRDCAAKGRLPTQVNPAIVQGENNGQHKLTETDVLEIRHAHALGAKQLDLAARFRVKPPTIHKIVTGLKWKHLLPANVSQMTVSRIVRNERMVESPAPAGKGVR